MTGESPWRYDKERFLDLLRRRGIRDDRVLEAMAAVPRERFVPDDMAPHAYDDSPLPIEEGQTISQPYVVALMIEALRLKPDARVLEIGTGSGYAAAVLGRVAGSVCTVERHRTLADRARARLGALGYRNVEVRCGDGSLGWPERAPFDAIVVTAGAPAEPPALIEQLAEGGRLVIPAGPTRGAQTLLRLTRRGGEVEREDLGAVRFVPLIGEQGWRTGEESPESPDIPEIEDRPRTRGGTPPPRPAGLPERIRRAAEPVASIDEADLEGFLERVGDARLVLLGEASHGTAEFHEMRARLTRELIERRGFRFVAAEADWPDAAQLDRFVRGEPMSREAEPAFTRFPAWMWANRQVLDFLRWLRAWNEGLPDDGKANFHGLDLYSLYSSMGEVVRYLEEVDAEAAGEARERYACLTPWQDDPAAYGAMALRGRAPTCERNVLDMLDALLRKRLDYEEKGGRRFLDAVANARLVRNAEAYYREIYRGSVRSWNLRDRHMFEILCQLLEFHGPDSRAVVWAHNSHLGDADATEMGERGELNLGRLCRERFGAGAYLVGFGTHEGTVAAATDWGGPMEIKQVRPSREDSYEHLCHEAAVQAFMLPLRGQDESLRRALAEPRLERAIGVIYRPETERHSHYFRAELPRQFDEYIWFDRSRAVDALMRESASGEPETFPFGL